eukprot:TRINITY_DN8377_c0_g1_i1.p1 TRINITY_DN8377_c0_g1~~TRINITY_DN8377_c0_g1_i1.p1  ORF type:complete len:144 (+),score=42.83 TRINITY_DN8377_c0_g1_i1:147-578(+)
MVVARSRSPAAKMLRVTDSEEYDYDSGGEAAEEEEDEQEEPAGLRGEPRQMLARKEPALKPLLPSKLRDAPTRSSLKKPTLDSETMIETMSYVAAESPISGGDRGSFLNALESMSVDTTLSSNSQFSGRKSSKRVRFQVVVSM